MQTKQSNNPTGATTNQVSQKKKQRKNRNRNKNTKSGFPGTLKLSLAAQQSVTDRSALQLRASQTVNFMSANMFAVRQGSTPGGVRLMGREMVQALNNGASSAFSVSGFNLNPVNLPRLAAYAPIYEEFFFHRANVIFQPSVGTQTAGVVSLWADYDVGDAIEATQVAAAKNITYSISNAYAVNACEILGSLCRLKRFLSISGATATILQTVQVAVRFASEGIPAPFSAPVGYIFVDYDVEFYVPN